ncbi:hypothetical protein DFJ73DRAFT_773851 [Zopfochytrium polystomum]|nr:hypothetical protein DFJ73DRAFT_773851 [Zopfochytrium polystomum]
MLPTHSIGTPESSLCHSLPPSLFLSLCRSARLAERTRADDLWWALFLALWPLPRTTRPNLRHLPLPFHPSATAAGGDGGRGSPVSGVTARRHDYLPANEQQRPALARVDGPLGSRHPASHLKLWDRRHLAFLGRFTGRRRAFPRLRHIDVDCDCVAGGTLDGTVGENVVAGGTNRVETTSVLRAHAPGKCVRRSLKLSADNGFGLAGHGGWVVHGGVIGEMAMWDLRAGAVVQTFAGHVRRVRCLGLAGRDCARVRDAATSVCVRVLDGHCEHVKSMDVGDGRIATRDCTGVVRVWDLESWNLIIMTNLWQLPGTPLRWKRDWNPFVLEIFTDASGVVCCKHDNELVKLDFGGDIPFASGF